MTKIFHLKSVLKKHYLSVSEGRRVRPKIIPNLQGTHWGAQDQNCSTRDWPWGVFLCFCVLDGARKTEYELRVKILISENFVSSSWQLQSLSRSWNCGVVSWVWKSRLMRSSSEPRSNYFLSLYQYQVDAAFEKKEVGCENVWDWKIITNNDILMTMGMIMNIMKMIMMIMKMIMMVAKMIMMITMIIIVVSCQAESERLSGRSERCSGRRWSSLIICWYMII